MNDLVKRLRELSNAVADGNQGEFTMRIPADPRRDADIVLSKAADELERLEAELAARKGEGELENAVVMPASAVEQMCAENERLRLQLALERQRHEDEDIRSQEERRLYGNAMQDKIDKMRDQRDEALLQLNNAEERYQRLSAALKYDKAGRKIDLESYDALLLRLDVIQGIVSAQALDEGLWFKAQTAPEGYLQQELRALHEVVEGKSGEECAREIIRDVERRVRGCPTEGCAMPLGHEEPCHLSAASEGQ